jgi:sulfate permease, SulP family
VQVDWSAVRAQLGTMASLGLFLLLLVPIRIPTLSLTTGEEADFNKEIKAHGIANLASGLCGSVHNYLRSVAVIQYSIC